MNTRNQNRRPRSPFSRKGGQEEVHGFKRRKIGGERMISSSGACSGREVLGVLTNIPDVLPANLSGNDFPECSGIEFTMEEVDALLNTKIKTKKFDIKEKMKQTLEHSCKLKLCIKWFQERDKTNLLDKENLQSQFDSAAKKWNDAELDMEAKISEFNDIISELKKSNTSLEAKLVKERLDKLDAIESHKKEKQARLVVEKLQTSLVEEVEKAKQENTAANQKITSLNNTYKSLQEYNTSLQQYNTKLQTDLAKSCESHKMVETEKLSVVESLCTVRTHYNSLQEQHSSCKISLDAATKQQDALVHEISCLRGELKQVRDDRDVQVKQVKSLNLAFSNYKESMSTSIAELNMLMTKAKELEDACSSQREQIRILENQLSSEKAKFKMADMSVYETRMEFAAQNRTICELQNRIKESEHKITEGEKLRKMLHNTILELKGNIRVFCRVRPLLPEDCASADATVISYPISTEAVGRAIDLMQSGQKYPFMFDKVFSHEASQDDVFIEISQLVQSALDGYKVCIFAYGQTGSGKTYTMMGEPQIPEQKGLIPRSLEQIFEISQSLCAQGWKYKMQASILEIYNETIRDLLAANRVDTNRSENVVSGKLYSIKHDASGNTSVSDLNIVDVCSIKEISSLLQKAAQSRSVGKTQMNEHSSRSHFVFTLRISGVNEVTGQHLQGVLNLIDLAGSERLSRSGATGDRLKEAQAINKSLSSLSDVIFALAKKEDHVPFRNSKLTYLLQPCLGGDSKVLMFVNISPDSPSFGESLCSLRFAARVNSCEIGIPRRQMAIKLPESRLSTG